MHTPSLVILVLVDLPPEIPSIPQIPLKTAPAIFPQLQNKCVAVQTQINWCFKMLPTRSREHFWSENSHFPSNLTVERNPNNEQGQHTYGKATYPGEKQRQTAVTTAEGRYSR